MKRRDFLSWVGVGTLATSLPMALAACGSNGDSATDDPATVTEAASADGASATADMTAQADGYTPLGTVSTLDQQGYLADENFPGGAVIAIRDPADASSVIALSSVCPHRGCNVEWQPGDEQFLCPCHQSAFEPDGSFISGPANDSLATYDAKIEGDQVLVQAS